MFDTDLIDKILAEEENENETDWKVVKQKKEKPWEKYIKKKTEGEVKVDNIYRSKKEKYSKTPY